MSVANQNLSNTNDNGLKDGLPQLQMVNGMQVQRLDEATLERHGLTGPVYITPSAAVIEGLDQAMAWFGQEPDRMFEMGETAEMGGGFEALYDKDQGKSILDDGVLFILIRRS